MNAMNVRNICSNAEQDGDRNYRKQAGKFRIGGECSPRIIQRVLETANVR